MTFIHAYKGVRKVGFILKWIKYTTPTQKGQEMTIIEDTNNKIDKHLLKHEWWQKQGVEIQRYRLPVGDYVLMNDKIQDLLDRKAKRGIPVKMMDFLGTYSKVCDSKESIMEIVNNVQSEHERFRDELILAKNNGIKLYIVIENEGRYVDYRKTIWNATVRCIDDLNNWHNPRLYIKKNGKPVYPKAMPGTQLAKICHTMEERYGCKFLFCKPDESAKLIIDLLQGKEGG